MERKYNLLYTLIRSRVIQPFFYICKMNTLKTRLKHLLAKAKTKQALQQLLDLNYIGESLKEEITLLNARFHKLQSEGTIKGILTQEEKTIRYNEINDALLLLIEKLPDEAELLRLKREDLAKKLGITSKEVIKITDELERRYSERLRQKLDRRLALSLQLSYTQEGTSEEYVETFFEEESKTTDTIPTTCLDVLQSHQHLLILGNPGAGKTTLLLELALNWVQKSEAPSLPIIFNLASWTLAHTSFREWLESSLVTGYGFSKEFAKKTLDAQLVLPLLDGLDEVGKKEASAETQQEVRSHCLEAIDQYIADENVPQFIICSRRKEYAEITQNAPIRAEILVNPLTIEQIKQELEKAASKDLSNSEINVVKKLQGLLKEGKSNLVNVLCTPFYFNLAFDAEVLHRFLRQTSQHYPKRKLILKTTSLRLL